MNLLQWLQFGKVSAERDDQLSMYFFDNGVLKQTVDSETSFLVLGRKGAGKTAVFKYLTENPAEYTKDEILIPLSFEDYNWNIHSLLDNSRKIESLSYKQSWKFVIVVESIKAIHKSYIISNKKIPKELKKATSLLEKLFDSPIPSINQIIGKKILTLSSLKLPKAGLDLEDDDIDLTFGGGEVTFDQVKSNRSLQELLSENIENLVSYLQTQLELLLKDTSRIFVCFDKVDEAWDDFSFESSKKVIAGLITACDSITTNYGGRIRPIVFLREDIFDVLKINDSNKLREDCGQLLHWNRRLLEQLLLRRVNFFRDQHNLNPIQALSEILPKNEMRHRAKPFNYILKRTMMRPRDVISYLNRIKQSMVDKAEDPFVEHSIKFSEIDSQSVYDAESGYSEWLKQELLDEWQVQYPEIDDIFFTLQKLGHTIFNAEEFEAQLKQFNLYITYQNIEEYLRFMYKNSIIGFRLGASKEWRFKCFYPSQGFILSGEYRVHEGLIRALNLKENGKAVDKST